MGRRARLIQEIHVGRGNVVVSDDKGRVWMFPVSDAGWEQHAGAVANRAFTSTEWSQFLPGLPYQQTCPVASGS